MIIVPETLIHAVFSQTETLESSIVKSVVRSRLLVTIDRLFRLSKTHPDWMQLEQLTVRFDNHHEADAWFSSFLSEGSSTKQTEQEGFPDAGSIAENPEFVAEAIAKEVPPNEKKDTDSLISLLLKLQETYASKPATNDNLVVEPEHIPPIQLVIDPFSESEKLYVRNAGMVLLWPFLERYFEKNGLLTESKFINKQQLLMNELLSAVIEHVPAWKNLSVENLRKAYLQREGALSARDGQWLLQVKRETYDILLDKLPWPIQLIRLPWLEHLLVVEW